MTGTADNRTARRQRKRLPGNRQEIIPGRKPEKLLNLQKLLKRSLRSRLI